MRWHEKIIFTLCCGACVWLKYIHAGSTLFARLCTGFIHLLHVNITTNEVNPLVSLRQYRIFLDKFMQIFPKLVYLVFSALFSMVEAPARRMLRLFCVVSSENQIYTFYPTPVAAVLCFVFQLMMRKLSYKASF